MSKSEDKIVKVFQASHIQVIREKTFEGLHGKKNVPLRFDFYLPQYNILVEYDSELHFQPITRFGGRAGYLAAKERDRKKNSYCLMHKIPLYRIPYWELSNIKTLQDIFNPKFRVANKFHNDLLVIPK